MSIADDEGNEIVKLNTVHAWAFKVAIWFAPIFAIWLVMKVLTHDTDIAVLKMQISMQSGGKGVSQSVNVGESKAGTAEMTTARTWLTTKQVAEREQVDERTVLNYIAAGQIEPAPVKNGKAWQISEQFRILPKTSETCGIETSP